MDLVMMWNVSSGVILCMLSGIIGRFKVILPQVKASDVPVAPSCGYGRDISPQNKLGNMVETMIQFTGDPVNIPCNVGETLPPAPPWPRL